MSLETYQKKRDFKKTAEPRGRLHKQKNKLFIIQKHAASHLHYDFRIELEGVLKSWAVPKGPCLDPNVKRLAMHVEDHPIEYGTFEGIIPKGEYGGGTVLLWDKGSWEPIDDNPLEAYLKGHLRFNLHAKKLNGRWDLFRFKSKESKDESKTWFLKKHEDDEARSLEKFDITESETKSVVSGLSLEEISEHYTAVWSKQGLKKKNPTKKKPLYKKQKIKGPASLFPSFIPPELATLMDKPPLGDDWAHEIKFDGYRILAFKQKEKVTLLSRNDKNWTSEFESIAQEIKKLPLDNLVLDGEMVLLDKDNRSNFQLLQNSIKQNKPGELIYYVFDILYYDQWDVRKLSLLERKNVLESLLLNISPMLRYSDHIIGNGDAMFKRACQFGLEGIISKRLDSSYTSKRSKSWLKIKCVKRQEFVVGGFSPGQGARSCFGSLFLGDYDPKGEFVFCGNVGTGFTDKSLQEIHSKLKKIIKVNNPFNSSPPGIKKATWVKPQLVVEVEFAEWTIEGRLRHASFKGLREDKKAETIIREMEKSVKVIDQKSTSTANENDTKINISNPKKILYPEDEITKKDICEYYSTIYPYILPYIKNRPLTLVRCPNNYKTCFFQKHMTKSSSKSLLPVPVENPKNHEMEDYIYLNDKEGLLALVQMGVLEIHPWGSTIDNLEYPDIVIFDLDPAPDVTWSAVVDAAVIIKGYLELLKLKSFVKNTGGKGLHVVVPINPEHDWNEIKLFSEHFVKLVEQQHPDKYVVNMSKAKRTGKIFLDYLRNQRNATAIAAYSTRARLHASVSTPLGWDELTNNIEDTFYTIHTLPGRLEKLKKDPWADFFKLNQSLKLD